MPNNTLHPPDLICGACGSGVGEVVQTVENVEVCRACEANLNACDSCRRPTGEYLRETVQGLDLCTECASGYSTCARCELLSRRTHDLAGGGEVCSVCADRHYWTCMGSDCAALIDTGDYCSDCDDDVSLDDGYYDSGSSCNCCGPRRESGSALIYNYSYKPEPVFHGEGPLYLGLELEIETAYDETSDCARIANAALGSLGYLKEDGSISRGFEMVTHPMSHEYARTQFPWQMLEVLAGRECTGEDTGLHVHVSRKGFASPSHVYRWLKFLHRNSEHVSVIARRDSDQWAAWNHRDRMRAKEHAKGELYGERYRAINVTNEATFEVRVFRSSLNPQEVQAALDLVAGSVEYTRELTVADINARGGWTWSAFTAWAAGRPEYSALTREIGADLSCAC